MRPIVRIHIRPGRPATRRPAAFPALRKMPMPESWPAGAADAVKDVRTRAGATVQPFRGEGTSADPAGVGGVGTGHPGKEVTMLTILLIVLIVLALSGGFGYGGGRYRSGGIGVGGILLIILLVLLLTGNL